MRRDVEWFENSLFTYTPLEGLIESEYLYRKFLNLHSEFFKFVRFATLFPFFAISLNHHTIGHPKVKNEILDPKLSQMPSMTLVMSQKNHSHLECLFSSVIQVKLGSNLHQEIST